MRMVGHVVHGRYCSANAQLNAKMLKGSAHAGPLFKGQPVQVRALRRVCSHGFPRCQWALGPPVLQQVLQALLCCHRCHRQHPSRRPGIVVVACEWEKERKWLPWH